MATFTCKTCGNEFISFAKAARKFCCHPCFCASDEFKQGIEKAVASRRKAAKNPSIERLCKLCGQPFKTSYNKKVFCSQKHYWEHKKGKERKARITRACIQCGSTIRQLESETGRYKKSFCNQICWRRFFSDRFDRWIANRESVCEHLPPMQNFDEFLTQDELYCLIPGCNWRGRNLGIHVSHKHGVSAAEFKELVGFNRNTGLITPDAFLIASERAKLNTNFCEAGKNFATDVRDISIPPGISRRLEAKEHHRKAIAMRWAEGRYSKQTKGAK